MDAATNTIIHYFTVMNIPLNMDVVNEMDSREKKMLRDFCRRMHHLYKEMVITQSITSRQFSFYKDEFRGAEMLLLRGGIIKPQSFGGYTKTSLPSRKTYAPKAT